MGMLIGLISLTKSFFELLVLASSLIIVEGES